MQNWNNLQATKLKLILLLAVPLVALTLAIPAVRAKIKASDNKKLINTAGFNPIYSPDSKYIVYSSSKEDGTEGPLYRKKVGSKSKAKGTQITDDGGSSPVYSPDGKSIVYVNLSNNYYLYKKDAGDDNDGNKFVKVAAFDPTYSPDGKYVVYANSDEDGRLYRKEAADTDDSDEGEEINGLNSHNPVYSSDGLHIYYINIDTSRIYKKDASDDNDGHELSGIEAYSFTVSPSGKYLVYSNVDDGGKLYRRKIDGSGAGTRVNNYTSNEPYYFPGGNKVVYSNGDKKLYLYSLKIKK
jgi:Tol biopolymer transport system component